VIFSVKILSYPIEGDNLEGCLHPSKSPRIFSFHGNVDHVTCIVSNVSNDNILYVVQNVFLRCLTPRLHCFLSHDNILTREKSPMGLIPLSNKQYSFEDFSMFSESNYYVKHTSYLYKFL